MALRLSEGLGVARAQRSRVATHLYEEFAGQALPNIDADRSDRNVDRPYQALNLVRVVKARWVDA